jgi:chromosome segregation ATPase
MSTIPDAVQKFRVLKQKLTVLETREDTMALTINQQLEELEKHLNEIKQQISDTENLRTHYLKMWERCDKQRNDTTTAIEEINKEIQHFCHSKQTIENQLTEKKKQLTLVQSHLKKLHSRENVRTFEKVYTSLLCVLFEFSLCIEVNTLS